MTGVKYEGLWCDNGMALHELDAKYSAYPSPPPMNLKAISIKENTPQIITSQVKYPQLSS
jgi:hypothetical protein